jgi:hypothetical protein
VRVSKRLQDVGIERWCDAMLKRSGPGADLPRLYAGLVATDPVGQAELRYRTLRDERRRGALDPRSFRAAVRQLRVVDSEGREWSLGPENGAWYRRDRDRWSEAPPPRRLVCGRCGHHNLQRHSFCTECGGKLGRSN